MKSNDVYKITNKITGKVYIGITNQGAGARYRHHWYEARIGEPAPIHRSMAKYGEENFTLEIIDFADTYEELKEKEKYWIKQYDSMNREKGYNLTEGGDGTFGRMHSEETKDKIRQKAIGRKVSEETKKKMSEAQKKYKDAHKAHADAIRVLNQKAVVAYDLEGNIVEEFNTTKECAEKYNTSSTTIKYYCRSEQPKVAKKFNIIWRYKNAA
nr:MAG: GIY-YIG catalytic domain protein [Bacteriophage sp.]